MYSTVEAAKRVGVSKNTLLRWLDEGLTEDVERYPPPVYLVEAEVEMREPEASDAHVVTGPPIRNVCILVFQDADEWVMAPAPREIRQRYAASRPADDKAAPAK